MQFAKSREVSLDTRKPEFCCLASNWFLLTVHLLLPYSNTLYSVGQLTCGVCFEAFPRSRMKSAACGHPFCCECWEGLFCMLLFRSRC